MVDIYLLSDVVESHRIYPFDDYVYLVRVHVVEPQILYLFVGICLLIFLTHGVVDDRQLYRFDDLCLVWIMLIQWA